MTDRKFTEGEEYALDNLPESDMTNSGNLEVVDREGTLAARYGDVYVEFEWSKVRCTDVTRVSEISQ